MRYVIPEGRAVIDKKDKQTIDIFTGNRPVGRPRVYSSNAMKQRCYRQRQKGKTSCNTCNAQ